jgi:hypothetical protein
MGGSRRRLSWTTTSSPAQVRADACLPMESDGEVDLAVSVAARVVLTAPAGRTPGLLQARRRTSVRTNQNRPANRAFSLERPTIGPRRVRSQSDPTQTHKPTAHAKKTCKCRPFRERLKGFEPRPSAWQQPVGLGACAEWPCKWATSAARGGGVDARLSSRNHAIAYGSGGSAAFRVGCRRSRVPRC